MLPDRSMPHLESRLVKKKVMVTGSKDLVSESLGVMRNEGYHSLFFISLIYEYWLEEKQYQVLNAGWP